MSNLGDVLSKLMYSNVSQTGSAGGSPSRWWLWVSGSKAPSRWAIFVCFWKKKAILILYIGLHFAHVHSHLQELEFQHLKANRKNLIV